MGPDFKICIGNWAESDGDRTLSHSLISEPL
jgi:hypothetical protein